MAAEEPLLFDLVEAVLEGRPVDWTAAESTISDSQRALLAHLRDVAGIASFHAGSSARRATSVTSTFGDCGDRGRASRRRDVGLVAGARARGPRRVRRRVPRPGLAARSRSRAEADSSRRVATRSGRVSCNRRRAAARARPTSERGDGLRRGSHRRAGRSVDGVRPRTHARSRPAGPGTVRRRGSDADRTRPVPGVVGGARRRI